MDIKQHDRRVLNLIGRVDMQAASIKKWSVVKLLRWQPSAKRIRFEGRCHCKRGQQLSYVIPGGDYQPSDPKQESCGFYCPHCGFGNAGSRDKKVERV